MPGYNRPFEMGCALILHTEAVGHPIAVNVKGSSGNNEIRDR
jgi:hypothetical protein